MEIEVELSFKKIMINIFYGAVLLTVLVLICYYFGSFIDYLGLYGEIDSLNKALITSLGLLSVFLLFLLLCLVFTLGALISFFIKRL